MTEHVPLITGDHLRRLLGPRQAVQVVADALRGGLDPAADPARTVVPTAHGHLLLMPAESGASAGVKVVTVAPDNPARGRPRIQGFYLLFDARTLSPVALIDGIALTTLRTPAVSVAAVLPLLRRARDPLRVAVFGAGPQGRGHVDTLLDTLSGHRGLAEVTYLVRDPRRAGVPGHGAVPVTVAASGDERATRAVSRADVVVCATTAREPLFDSAVLRDRAVVIAVGSHEPGAREVDGALAGRAHVVVDDVATALREAGDVVQAIGEGHLDAARLIPMRRIVTDPASVALDRPVLFKSTGMSWQDLVVAAAAHERLGG
ncbi:ornithine cyclodeaminase family protein [Streptosporangium sp. NPDC050855]|uniref:ornithine cyclodeaminase family protein n=1 Tax=Streptosporangium sp. NPDC050855 TaxID=3366194 RepID=UPI0037A9BAFB